jgi:hypothetical protein
VVTITVGKQAVEAVEPEEEGEVEP